MGRGDSSDDDVFGGLYSPYQRGMLAEDRVKAIRTGAPLPNPLDTSAAIQPTAVAEPSVAPVSNPLVQPAFPLSTMSPERQLRWQAVSQEAQKAQSDLDTAEINREIARREDAHKQEIIRQSREMIGRSAELDPSNLKDYPLARAKLARDYPIGAGSEQVQRALKPLDDVFTEASRLQTYYDKQVEAQTTTEGAKRRDDAKKMAGELGADYFAKFLDTEKREGTEAAINEVTKVAATEKQADVIAQLKAGGQTEEEIRQKYGGTDGRPFRQVPAEAEAKKQAPAGSEYKRAADNFNIWQKLKDNTSPTDWTDAHQQGYEDAILYLNSVGQKTLARAGVQGFDPVKAKADKEAKDIADAAAAKAKAEAEAAQPNRFAKAWADLWGPAAPAAVPGATPAALPTPTPTPAPTPRPSTTPVPAPVSAADPTLRIDRITGKRFVVGNRTAANPKGEWVEVQ